MTDDRKVLGAAVHVDAATTNGAVRGASSGGVVVFRGVPYGASTGGANRFRPPQPVARWTGVRDALTFGATCSQPSSLGATAPSVEPFIGSLLPDPNDEFGENCLSVNVYTPGADDGCRPVMVWFHGGGQTIGSGNLTPYNGSNLAHIGNVVVVTVNHRLGALAYLSLAGVPGGDDYASSGNAGLLDMVASLQWVRDNIRAFGGDPGNVTIFGESGGGSKVSVLLGTPAAAGLFHRAIIQSGPTLEAELPDDAARTTAAIMAHLGVSTVNELLASPVDALVAAQLSVLGSALGGTFGSGHRLGPVIDGAVLPAHPFEPTAAAPAAQVPLMIGTCRDEMTMFLLDAPAIVDATHDTGEQIAQALSKGVTGLYGVYRARRPGQLPGQILIAIATEAFRLGSITLAERKVAGGTAPVWMYRCDVTSPASGGAFGATHSIDLPLVFGDLPHPLLDGHPRATDISASMMATWVQFARHGDPNNASIPPWRPYTHDDRATLLFDTECTVVIDPDGDERRAWGGRRGR